MKKVMKLQILMLCLSSFATNVFAQSEVCSCESDLKLLDSKIRKIPAYQINKKKYKNVFATALQEVASTKTLFECHHLLNELLIALNDNHSKVYGTDLGATDEVMASPEMFSKFKKSALFNSYPKPDIDLGELMKLLNSKEKKGVEGVYQNENGMKIGVYKSNDRNVYNAIVLDSVSDVWEVGEIIYTLFPLGNDYLLSVGGNTKSKRMIAYVERVGHGFFYFMGFQKDMTQINYASNLRSEKTYYRESISDEITYLKIGSFDAWYPTLSDAERFYETLKGNLNKKYLILDLRNNRGGGDRNSDILFKILKRYAKQKYIYLLINHRTISNAEQFAHKLSQLKNVRLFGMRTNGTLAYEVKDELYTLPCGNFRAVLSSKKHTKYLEFESKGIVPDITFDQETDWVEQLIDYIENNNHD